MMIKYDEIWWLTINTFLQVQVYLQVQYFFIISAEKKNDLKMSTLYHDLQ